MEFIEIQTKLVYENDMIFIDFFISVDQNNISSLVDSENNISELDFVYYAKRNSGGRVGLLLFN